MRLEEFKQLVAEHPGQYEGVHPHSESELVAMEAKLGFAFPDSLRWLLTTHGYARATGVDSLNDSVDTTLRCREAIGLPNHWLILNEWGDAGVVMLDSVSNHCCWCGSYDIVRVARSEDPEGKVSWFENFAEWSKDRLDDAIEEERY